MLKSVLLLESGIDQIGLADTSSSIDSYKLGITAMITRHQLVLFTFPSYYSHGGVFVISCRKGTKTARIGKI